MRQWPCACHLRAEVGCKTVQIASRPAAREESKLPDSRKAHYVHLADDHSISLAGLVMFKTTGGK
jgi:hypothetical protein